MGKAAALIAVSWCISLGIHAQAGEGKKTTTLEGVWRGYVVEGKGENPNEGPVKLQLVIQDDRIEAVDLRGDKGKDLGKGTFRLTKDGTALTIDATRTSAPGKGQTYLGIYSVQGGKLRWCVAMPGKDRPAEYLTKRGQFLMVLERQKD